MCKQKEKEKNICVKQSTVLYLLPTPDGALTTSISNSNAPVKAEKAELQTHIAA